MRVVWGRFSQAPPTLLLYGVQGGALEHDRKTAMRESDIDKYLVERVKELGGEVRKVKWIGRNGAPDRLVMLPSMMMLNGGTQTTVWVELKAPGEKAKPHQVREHERMRKMGQRVEVIDSLEGVDDLLS